MGDSTAPAGREVDQDHLDRSRKMWDRWSDRYGRSERDFAPMLDDAVERLDVTPGDTVLEVGCGPGTNFERIHDQVGTEGTIVAVDYSPKMVERARERAAEQGLDNVEVFRADATQVALDPGRFDAALASLSMSVMPDIEAAARRVHEALRPGAHFVVFDVRRVPSGSLRVLNPLIARFYRWYANWNADDDVEAAVRTVFGHVDVEATYLAGAAYRARTKRSEETAPPDA
jgi:ubiquinone/menaquinone biosynthesis C-methylase UbiE